MEVIGNARQQADGQFWLRLRIIYRDFGIGFQALGLEKRI